MCEYLTLRKHFFYRQNNTPIFDIKRQAFRAQPKYTPKGIADILVIKDGFAIFLEVKRPKTYQSKEQKVFEQMCKDAGAEYYTVRSIDDLKEVGL